jgi:flagellar hook protein FlgE
MSLFDSLTTAVSGLTAQQKAISNISDNIANAQTIGYKGVDTSFESLVLSNGNNQDSGDVGVKSVFTNDVAGSVVQSQQSTSLAINGDGFFVVKAPPASNSTGSTQTFSGTDLYTRRGDFQVNTNGYLVNGAGYYLEGYAVDPTTGTVGTGSTAPLQIPQTQSAPQASTLLTLLANLPSSSAAGAGAAGFTSPPVTTQVYDAQGNPHNVSMVFDHTAANTWTATITSPDSQAPDDTPITLTLNFSDGTDKVVSTDANPAPAGTLLKITDTTTYPTGADASTVTTAADNGPATLSVNWNFLGSATDVAQPVTLSFGSYGSTTSSLTQFAGTAVQVAGEPVDGSAPGTFTGVSVDNNGFVSLSYSNGQTVKAFQLALAQFNAPDSLQSVDGNTFATTEDSGNPIVSAPGVGGNGTISPSSLEQSNVDISTELTKLITAQQVYTSNAKVITTANQMLQTVSNLIQG